MWRRIVRQNFTTFPRNMLPHFQGRRFTQFVACFLFSLLTISSALEMEAGCSSETLNFCRTTWHHIPEESTLSNILNGVNIIVYNFKILVSFTFASLLMPWKPSHRPSFPLAEADWIMLCSYRICNEQSWPDITYAISPFSIVLVATHCLRSKMKERCEFLILAFRILCLMCNFGIWGLAA
jgi:hypothetical protein